MIMRFFYTLLALFMAANAVGQSDMSPVIADSMATAVTVEADSDTPQADADKPHAEPAVYRDTTERNRVLGQVDPINQYRVYNGPDVKLFKNTTNPAVKPYTFIQDQTWTGIPVFLAGLIAKGEKEAFRQNYNNPNTKIRLIKYNFHSEVDNYTQFSGIALTAGLKLAGVEGRSSWPRLVASSLASYGVMAAFVNGIKYTAKELRPDGSTRNSWPSGHTATAFVGATILHKEYGLTRSPWYSVAGYSLATATGVMRVLNNRHWISDVLSGAGIGILSTELAYGICDLLFKQKGLLMNDLSYYPDLRHNPSFFSLSMGIGMGNKHLELPSMDFIFPGEEEGEDEIVTTEPLQLKFRSATAVGVEGAWFFNPYVGVGGRLRVKSTPINGWSSFALSEKDDIQQIKTDPDLGNAIKDINLIIESDHITEFAADLGVFFNLPLSSRFALGSKLLAGRSVMDDIDVNGTIIGKKLQLNLLEESDDLFILTDEDVTGKWDYVNVQASNSMKFGTGLSLTYAHKNSFSWRVFCDYDYSHKTFKATYHPFGFIEVLSPDAYSILKAFEYDPVYPHTSSTRKQLHQWVLGGALCVSF